MTNLREYISMERNILLLASACILWQVCEEIQLRCVDSYVAAFHAATFASLIIAKHKKPPTRLAELFQSIH